MSKITTLYDLLSKGPLIRGTKEWDDRERARRSIGCRCLSFGSVMEARQRELDSIKTYQNFNLKRN